MINVGKAFTWDLLGSAYYMGELAARYPARKVNRLTPDVKNILIKDFIVESADQFFTANGIPEIPFNQVVVENGEIKCKKLIGALNDAAGFTMRKLTIEAQHNDIHILDGKGADLLTLHEELNLSNRYVLYFVQLRIAKVKPSRKVPLISTSLLCT